MASSFSLFRFSYRWISKKWRAGTCPSPRNRFLNRRDFHQTSDSPSRVQNSCPWLMLPPVVDNAIISYNFYSLAEDIVITLPQKGLTDLMTKANRRFRFTGSSHGWLALVNPHNLDLFLYNPISRLHIKLPPVPDFPNYPNDFVTSRGVERVILSCSPDEDEENCRAVIAYNGKNGLAYCCPGRSKEWTLISDVSWWNEGLVPDSMRGYIDFIYSARENVFLCLSEYGDVEFWDLKDLSFPRMINMLEVNLESYRCNYKLANCRDHLVVVDKDLLVVSQFVGAHDHPDGSCAEPSTENWDKFPHMTEDFVVQKYDPETGDFKGADDGSPSALDGLALFVGYHSHSVALPAATHGLSYLKPNSIYFTDPIGREPLDDYDFGEAFGHHDIGIFSLEDKTVSSCYYPCDVQSLKRIVPPPMWFFPSLATPC